MKTTILLIALGLLFSCNDISQLDGKDYLGWVKNPENGLKIEKNIGEISYSVQYKPYEFITLNEEKDYQLSKDLVNKRNQELDGMVYYNFRISTLNQTDILAKGLADKSDYINRISYLSYDFQSNIKLITESDSINCALYHFVQGHGIVPYVDMALGFPIKDLSTNQTLEIDDQVFGNGIIKFYIDKKNIKRIPQLVTV